MKDPLKCSQEIYYEKTMAELKKNDGTKISWSFNFISPVIFFHGVSSYSFLLEHSIQFSEKNQVVSECIWTKQMSDMG